MTEWLLETPTTSPHGGETHTGAQGVHYTSHHRILTARRRPRPPSTAGATTQTQGHGHRGRKGDRATTPRAGGDTEAGRQDGTGTTEAEEAMPPHLAEPSARLGTATPRGQGTKAQAPREGNPTGTCPTHRTRWHAQTPPSTNPVNRTTRSDAHQPPISNLTRVRRAPPGLTQQSRQSDQRRRHSTPDQGVQLTYRTAQHSITGRSTTQRNTAQCTAAQHNRAQHNAAWHPATRRITARHGTTRYSTARHGTARHGTARQGRAGHSAAQRGAAQRSTAKHSKAH